MSAIRSIEVRPVTARMPRPWVPEDPAMRFVVVEVTDDDGARGTGFSWTPTIGATAVAALLTDDIRRFAVGRTTDPHVLWPELWAHLHEAGSSGVTTIAMAGLDLALWDLAGRRAERSVAELIGLRREVSTGYGSGVNLHYEDDELREQLTRWVEAGFDAVKIKVGSASLERDLRRVAAARALLGGERRLMVDANQRWSVEQAIHAVERLAEYGVSWVEEPVRADDLAGAAAVAAAAARVGVPIALGENLGTRHRFGEAMERGSAAVLQPNVVRVGGITPWLRIVDDIVDAGLTPVPHVLPDLSAQLAQATPVPVAVEVVEDAGLDALGVLAAPSPVTVHAGRVTVSPHHGLGLTFDAFSALPGDVTARGPRAAGPREGSDRVRRTERGL